MTGTETYYTDIFGVDRQLLDKVMAAALKDGGDYADLFFENTVKRSLVLRDGEVSSGAYIVDYGVGIRVLKGERTGYAYAESTDRPSLLSAASAASSISMESASGTRAAATVSRPSVPHRDNPVQATDRYPIETDWRDCEACNLIPILKRLEELIRVKDPRIIKIMLMLADSTSDVLMYNSHGELRYDTRPMGTLAASVVFGEGGVVQNNHVSRSFRMGREMLTETLLQDISGEAVRNMDDKLAARRPKGGRMPVVMGAGASGILLHEAMGHAFEADFNRKGQSIFSGKIGQRICSPGINIVDDATLKGNRGSLNFDDEGVPGQKTYMVEDGILVSYLHDRISADYYNVRPTGNGRRENFRYNPIPRMRATYMESGNADPESIIASVKNGVYVDEFTNGQVKIGEGDFTFYVKSGYLIENGHLTMPIKDINIMGNGPAALADIAAVGNDARVDEGAWTCGKGQSVPVSCGIPTVLVNELAVGGD